MNASDTEARARLDVALVVRGLAASRSAAARMIADGLVTVDGKPARKPATAIFDRTVIAVAESDHYVSRAAHKLAAALDAFPVEVSGSTVLDVGASTGGFTQVLLERGARQVIALDVGHDQLAPSIRADSRVTVVEGVNARYLGTDELDAIVAGRARPSMVVVDVSFIPLGLVLPALAHAVGAEADIIALIKPQFEVGRGRVKEGIVPTAELREDAVLGVLWSAWDLGLNTAGLISSPIAGAAGNREYLAWFSTSTGTNPTEWSGQVSALTQG